jgi:hypothetical protein
MHMRKQTDATREVMHFPSHASIQKKSHLSPLFHSCAFVSIRGRTESVRIGG